VILASEGIKSRSLLRKSINTHRPIIPSVHLPIFSPLNCSLARMSCATIKLASALTALLVTASSATQTSQSSLTLHSDTSGCGISHDIGFHNSTDQHYLPSGNWTRYYAVNVPSTYNDDLYKQWPLIIDYHGAGGTPDGQYNNSMYYKYEDGQNYLVVYPAGINKHWQGPSYATKGVDDLQFTTDLLAHLRMTYCIDSTRIYASGKSNGGGFVDTLACSDNGDEFAAFAMAAAALYTDTREDDCPQRRVILESHGDRDATIPYCGDPSGNGGALPNITQWGEWWGQRDGCDPVNDRQQTGDLGGYDITSYSCKGLDNVFQHYQVYDLGHCWPSSTGHNTDGRRKYCKHYHLDYTPVVLELFGKWDLNKSPK
jgi:poly(3-hydroxybutyrate) depolymerase